MYIKVKRVIDFILALIGMPFLGIILLASAICIKLEDGGPVFYLADLRLEDGSTYNSVDDPRVTKFGKFARKTSIDETPQLINILKGDMALIGPRPDSASYFSQYSEEERKILKVRPGVTGYNQAINRNAVGTKEKLKNDIYYVEHMSFLFDVKIICMTVKTVLFRKNIYRVDKG